MEDRIEPPEGFVGIAIPGEALIGLIAIECVNRVAQSMQRNLELMEGISLRINGMSPELREEFEQVTDYKIDQLRSFTLEIFALNIFYLEKMVADLDPEMAHLYGTVAEDINKTNELKNRVLEKMKERRDEFALKTAEPLGQDA